MVYVNRLTDPLHAPNCWGPEAAEEGEGGGGVEKNGGGKIGGSGNEENSARAAPKRGGGETRGRRHKFTMHIIFKGARNILTRLAHRNYFFGFVLVDFTLLTWHSKKMFTNFYIFLNKRVYILYKVPIRSV